MDPPDAAATLHRASRCRAEPPNRRRIRRAARADGSSQVLWYGRRLRGRDVSDVSTLVDRCVLPAREEELARPIRAIVDPPCVCRPDGRRAEEGREVRRTRARIGTRGIRVVRATGHGTYEVPAELSLDAGRHCVTIAGRA